VRGEVQTKTTFQRSAKGNITINECEPNGKFITLENTHRSKAGVIARIHVDALGNKREIFRTRTCRVAR
jgi:intermediate filament protein if